MNYVEIEKKCDYNIKLSKDESNELFNELDKLHTLLLQAHETKGFVESEFPILYQIWNYFTKQD
jgi:hypothetical protein